MFQPKPLFSQNSATVIGSVATFARDWCVTRHLAYDPADPTAPPEIVFIHACPLRDAFKFNMAQRNSEWQKLFMTEKRYLAIQIVSSGEKFTCMNEAAKLARSINPMPRCNVYGYDAVANNRVIVDEKTGTEYASQADAAAALNLSQSHISRHLRGELASVKGHVFRYKNTIKPAP